MKEKAWKLAEAHVPGEGHDAPLRPRAPHGPWLQVQPPKTPMDSTLERCVLRRISPATSWPTNGYPHRGMGQVHAPQNRT